MKKKSLIIVGSLIALAGIGYVIYKTFSKKEKITKEQKQNLNIQIVRTDV